MLNQHIIRDARQISSGTVATLSGLKAYQDIDELRQKFVEFCESAEFKFNNWYEAWNFFKEAK